MNVKNHTEIHPDVVFESLLSTALHSKKRDNLALLHTICQERHKIGAKDFSLKSIAESFQIRGGLKGKALWNPQSSDYRCLVEVWQAFSVGTLKPRQLNKVTPQVALIETITDPATRIVVQALIRERDQLKAEVNLLKSQTVVTIDRRPQALSHAKQSVPNSEMTLEIRAGVDLSVIEREALEHALSKEFWNSEGWSEEKYGRIVKHIIETGRSRTIFKPGFTTAVRKILAI